MRDTSAAVAIAYRRHGDDLEAGQHEGEGDVGGSSSFMADHFGTVQTIQHELADVRCDIDSLKELKRSALLATSPEREKEVRQSVNELLGKTNKKVLKLKNDLEKLKADNKNFSVGNPDSAEARIRDNMTTTLVNKFRLVLMDYQRMQTAFRQDIADKVARQVMIVCPDADEAEVRQLADEPEAGQAYAAAAIQNRIQGTSESMKNAVADIQDKYRDIRRLEASVAELNQMFVELAAVVEAQGDLLDQIEFSVNSAKEYTEKAEKDLVEARKFQEQARKRMCWISICLMILAVVVMTPLIIVLVT
eukprot:GHVU01223267.1.p1 GENE.GHVU01223267.1~~GHVU01223267.1.p1  ORF type:complete len:316 (+),score=81.81 GHVU01223267.1:34-948(+)